MVGPRFEATVGLGSLGMRLPCDQQYQVSYTVHFQTRLLGTRLTVTMMIIVAKDILYQSPLSRYTIYYSFATFLKSF